MLSSFLEYIMDKDSEGTKTCLDLVSALVLANADYTLKLFELSEEITRKLTENNSPQGELEFLLKEILRVRKTVAALSESAAAKALPTLHLIK